MQLKPSVCSLASADQVSMLQLPDYDTLAAGSSCARLAGTGVHRSATAGQAAASTRADVWHKHAALPQLQHMQLEIASLAPTQQCVPDAHVQGSLVPGSHRAAACRQRQRRHAAFCFTQSSVLSTPESTHICTGLAGAGGHKATAAVASKRHLQPFWSHTLMQTTPLGRRQAPDPHPWIAQASLALASTEPLLQRVPTFADDLPLLEAVAILLKPSYALAGGAWPDPDSRGV